MDKTNQSNAGTYQYQPLDTSGGTQKATSGYMHINPPCQCNCRRCPHCGRWNDGWYFPWNPPTPWYNPTVVWC